MSPKKAVKRAAKKKVVKKVAKRATKKAAPARKPYADDARLFLRHTVATVAYRGGKAVRGAPESFAHFKAGPTTRSPIEILAHMGDLFDWALSQAEGKERWNSPPRLPWEDEVKRFHASLEAFDAYLGSRKPLHKPAERMFQGAVADSLTHTGQLTMLRRLAGSHVRGENYSRADIRVGQVGAKQPPPPERSEFD
jgi:hypothetical protein